MSLKRCQLGWTSRGDLLLDQMGFSWNSIPNNTTEVWGKKPWSQQDATGAHKSGQTAHHMKKGLHKELKILESIGSDQHLWQ